MIEFEINTNKKQIDFEVTQGIPKYVPANFQSKTVIPMTEQQIVRADIGYDGLEQVTVEKINLSNKTITENGTYNAKNENIDGYSSVEVNVQPTLQEKSVTITENGTTEVVADHGYDGLAKVSVEANVKDNSLLNVIKGMNSYQTYNYPFELTADMWDENSTTIYQYKFYNNKNITKVTIPNNIKTIGSSSFYGCTNLTSITISNSVTTIGISAFRDCSRLTNITIPNSVRSIENDTFYGCSRLTSVTIGNSVTSIGSYAFASCGLTNITIPNSVTSIGSYAFASCGLTNITIPNSVTSIGSYTFSGCSRLTSVTIGNSVMSIGNGVFNNCRSLTKVDFRSATQVPTVQSSSFYGVLTTCKFIIPDSLYDSWIASTNWVSLYNKGYQFIKASEYTEA